MIGANCTVTTYRLEVDGSGHQAYGSAVISGQDAWIEQLDAEAASFFASDDSVFFVNSMHLDGLPDLKISDKVIDSDGYEYIVRGVQPFRGGDIPDHTEAVIVRVREFV